MHNSEGKAPFMLINSIEWIATQSHVFTLAGAAHVSPTMLSSPSADWRRGGEWDREECWGLHLHCDRHGQNA